MITAEQRKILHLIASGYRDDEIAAQLSVSMANAKRKLHILRQTLGANNRAHALAIALTLGLISLPEIANAVRCPTVDIRTTMTG